MASKESTVTSANDIKQPAEGSELEEGKEEEQPTPWAWIKAVFKILKPPFAESEPLPVEILPWLYLSDKENSVEQIDKLCSLGITHVLTTNGRNNDEFKNIRSQLQNLGIKHYMIRASDKYDYDILGKHWEECKPIFQKVRNSRPRGKIVVHCGEGVNRSAFLVAAAMLTLGDDDAGPTNDADNTSNNNLVDQAERHDADKITLLTVVNHLQQKRGKVLTNLAFQKQLCELAAREGRLGEKPVGYTDDPLF